MIGKSLKAEALIELHATEVTGAFTELAEVIRRVYRVRMSVQQIVNKMLTREEVSPTAIEGGFAIPHVRASTVSKPCVAIGISRAGIAMGAADGGKTHLLFMLLGPEEPALFLGELSRITKTIQRLQSSVDFASMSPKELFQQIAAMTC